MVEQGTIFHDLFELLQLFHLVLDFFCKRRRILCCRLDALPQVGGKLRRRPLLARLANCALPRKFRLYSLIAFVLLVLQVLGVVELSFLDFPHGAS